MEGSLVRTGMVGSGQISQPTSTTLANAEEMACTTIGILLGLENRIESMADFCCFE
jgi:hypothetical protein